MVVTGVIIVLTGRDIFCGNNRFDNSTDWGGRGVGGGTFSVAIISVIITLTGVRRFLWL